MKLTVNQKLAAISVLMDVLRNVFPDRNTPPPEPYLSRGKAIGNYVQEKWQVINTGQTEGSITPESLAETMLVLAEEVMNCEELPPTFLDEVPVDSKDKLH